jgi:hypothetical protein
LYREIDGFGSEIDDERIAFELSSTIFVHLDARFAGINLLCNDTTFGENVIDLFLVDIERDGGDVDGGVDSCFLRLVASLRKSQ